MTTTPPLETQPPIRTVYASTMALLKALNVPMAHEVVTCLVAHRTNLHRRRSQYDLSKDAKAEHKRAVHASARADMRKLESQTPGGQWSRVKTVIEKPIPADGENNSPNKLITVALGPDKDYWKIALRTDMKNDIFVFNKWLVQGRRSRGDAQFTAALTLAPDPELVAYFQAK